MKKVCLTLLLFTAGGSAQDFHASLNGRITDPSGAPIAGAAVLLREVDRNETSRQSADAGGNYVFALIQPGNYELSVSHPGFKTLTRNGLTFNVNQSAEMNLSLEIGKMSDQVTVTAEVPQLEMTGDRGGLIDGKTISEMPLNGRNPFMLASLAAGVDYNGSLAYQRPFDNGAIAQWGVGGSSSSAEFLVDGVANNAQAGSNNVAYVPPVDAIQEFRVLTNLYDAQFGKTAGGVMNAILKSGSNGIHGSLYEFMRRNWLDANSFQNNAHGAGKDGHSLDQYGVLLDGPVYLPHVYNGHDRTFFMVNYERYVENSPQPLILSVPTLEMRQGDFSALKDKDGRQIVIYDPATGFTNSQGKWDRLPFANNVIPASRVNPISRKILSYFPTPNTQTSGVDYAQSDLFLAGGDNPASDNFYNLAIKMDQNLGEKHRFFVHYARNDRTEIRPTNGVGANSPGVIGPDPLKRTNDSGVLDWVSTLSPTVIVNVRTSLARYVEASWTQPNKNFDMASLGFPKSLISQLPYGEYFGYYTFSGYQSLGGYPGSNITNTFTLHPEVTWARGSKTLKGGLDMRWTQYSTQDPGNVMTLGASAGFTQRDYTTSNALAGNSIASWLLGTPSSGTVNYNVFPIYLFPYIAPWMQFDWKVSSRLTLDMGIRQDFNLPPTERYNRLDRGFDPAAASAIDSLVDRRNFPLPVLTGSLLFAGVNGQPRDAANPYYKTWQPRVGFAWRLRSRTVVRGGWGRFYNNPNNDYLQTGGFSISTPLVFSTNESKLPLNNKINDPFPDGILQPTGSSQGSATLAGRSFSFVNPHFRTPHVDNFSLSLQHSLPAHGLVEIAYSGTRAYDQQDSRTLNDVPAGLRDSCNYYLGGNPSRCNTNFPTPFANIPAFDGISSYFSPSSTLSRATLSEPFPQFGQIKELMRNDGRVWYNSGQVTYSIHNRWSTLRANYAFSKSVARTGFLDPQNFVMQSGPTAYDIPRHFSLSAVTQIPGGHRGSRLWRQLAGGWENSIIIQQQSGRPWALPTDILITKDPRIPIDWNQQVVHAIQPCVAQYSSAANNSYTVNLLQYSKDAGCTSPDWIISPQYSPRYEPNSEGNIRLQGFRLIDFSLNKTTQIGDHYRVQFRAEVFNSFNSFFLTNQGFDTTASGASFGSIVKAATSAPNSNYPRQAQLGFKLLW